MRQAWLLILVAGCTAEPPPAPAPARPVLRVAADPNNMPFSNDRCEGFENKIAALVAEDLRAELQFVWRAQRRGFFRNAFAADDAHVVMGVPAQFEKALATKPYYRSRYCIVTRTEDRRGVMSLDSPLLKTLRVGVPVAAGEFTPPAFAMARRGLVDNVTGFTLYGDYREPNPPLRLIDALAERQIDVAIAWGPAAAWGGRQSKVPLTVAPLADAADEGMPLDFAIAIGVKPGESILRDRIDAILVKRKAAIDAILQDFAVPRTDAP